VPWNEVSIMDQRRELECLATFEGANVAELCRRFAASLGSANALATRSQSCGPGDRRSVQTLLADPKTRAASNCSSPSLFFDPQTGESRSNRYQQPQLFTRLVRLNVLHRRPIDGLKNPFKPPAIDKRQLNLKFANCQTGYQWA